MFMVIFPTTYSGIIGEITGYMLKPKKQLDAPIMQPPSGGMSISEFITWIFTSISVIKHDLHICLSLQLQRLFHLRRKLRIRMLTGMGGQTEHFPEILHLKKSALTTISKCTGLRKRMESGVGTTLRKNG